MVDSREDDLLSEGTQSIAPLRAASKDDIAHTRAHIEKSLNPRRILWTPQPEQIENSNIVAFLHLLKETYGIDAPSIEHLYEWSVEKPEDFWRSFLRFSNMIYEGDDTAVLTYAPLPDPPPLLESEPRSRRPGEGKRRMIDARWFPDVRLNFAENLLHTVETNPDKEAIAFFGEDQFEQHLTYRDLERETVHFSTILDAYDVKPNDRVAALMPNIPETVSAMLAVSARGALWSSVSPEFGADTVVDRFEQLQPKVLFASDGHLYRGNAHNALQKIREIEERIPSIEHTVLIPYIAGKNTLDSTAIRGSDKPLAVKRLPFQHPLFVLFSSGTEGKSKCIVHGAGGILLNQLKQHLLHTDLRPDDTFFFNTRTSWMMWNSLLCALGAGAKIVLYDGDPLMREGRILFDIAEKERVTVFGTSAGFLAKIEEMGLRPRSLHNLSSMRTMLSTGSRLYGSQFDYVYEHVHPTVQLASTSGGTEILGAFATASPVHPVRREELQTRSLGYNVNIFDERGNPVPPGVRGELVCTAPFPSQPIKFWNDPADERYLATYFAKYGPSIWRHGDDAELTPSGGMVIHGRSDDLIKRGGVRMGSAEITMQAEKIPEILEAAALGYVTHQKDHIVLFVVLQKGQELTDALKSRIRSEIRSGASPYHIPDIILSVPDLPRTNNGKISTSAIRAVIHNKPVTNMDALRNPECLTYFQNRPELAV